MFDIVEALFEMFSWLPFWFNAIVIFVFILLIIIGLIRFIRWIIETIPGF